MTQESSFPSQHTDRKGLIFTDISKIEEIKDWSRSYLDFFLNDVKHEVAYISSSSGHYGTLSKFV